MFSFFKKDKSLLPSADCAVVVSAVKEAERLTTGEIRVYIESHCPMVNPIDRCEQLFVQLNMHETKEQNGVLIYLALRDRQFAIAGDRGINELVGGNAYWQQAAESLKGFLKKGAIAEGIASCVRSVGNSLATHFPYKGGDNINELPDEIVFGK
ncbi:TPM domain-containing protein [Rurimicrobium arvi]|uniref:TPM domain-containing protein n=1 Tax=Rurimicrobium arvi TaxID=2049916 RepID=A0ABP8MV84_9BACT